MSYKVIDTKENKYQLINGEYYTYFDAGKVFSDLFSSIFSIDSTFRTLSTRRGSGSRVDSLLELTLKSLDGTKETTCFIYVFPTESGGRRPDEARVQWRAHASWSPDLSTLRPAKKFTAEIKLSHGDLTDKETYIFAIYKRDRNDSDVVLSAIYPTQAQDVEISGGSPKSIQYKIKDIRDAYIKGISSTEKSNRERLIHFRPENLLWYMFNRDTLHTSTLQEFVENSEEISISKTAPVSSKSTLEGIPRNKIIYGAPGTGKSYELRSQASANGFKLENTTRLTFHPNYSYQQFIGSYKPVPIYKVASSEGSKLFESDKITELKSPHDKEPLIDYSFSPGPFIDLLIRAKLDLENNYLLIIEEINRANVAAVFGDVFQLLDRDNKGESEYEISFNRDVTNYLYSKGIDGNNIKLPANFFIWATMNSADQGVMPLDSAFKRRWSFEFLPLNAKQGDIPNKEDVISFQGKRYGWNIFREKLNNKLKGLGIAEDKLIGPFFLNNRERKDSDAIKNKLLLYLRDDVLRHNPESLFKSKSFSDIIEDYANGNVFIGDFEFPVHLAEPAEEATAEPAEEATAEPAEEASSSIDPDAEVPKPY